jgi:hypothetical protein
MGGGLDMAEQIGLREQVKKGLISATEALEKITKDRMYLDDLLVKAQPSQEMVTWLKNRIARGLDKVEAPKSEEKSNG